MIEKLTSNVRVAPDGIKADNFDAVVPAIGTMVGGGTIDSKNELDFKMAATLTDVIGDAASPVSAAGSLLGKFGGGGCKKGTTVPFQIKGTTKDPKFIPDVGGLAAGMLKSQLGCVGGIASGAAKTPQNTASPLEQLGGSALGGLLKKKKP